MNRAQMVEKIKLYGRQDMYIIAMGTIQSNVNDDFYTDAEKLAKINETINSLVSIQCDESLPWKAKRTPVVAEVPEEIILTDSITRNWTCEEIMRQEG